MTTNMKAEQIDHVHGPHVSMAQEHSATGVPGRGKGRPFLADVGRLLLHLAEMLAAMMAGMMIFHLLVRAILAPLGYAAAFGPGTDLHTIGMAVFMTLPMAAWMRVRGHGWRLGAEMSAAMLLPMAAVVVLCRLGADTWLPWLAQAASPAMYLGMFAAIIYRRDHYLGHHNHPVMALAH